MHVAGPVSPTETTEEHGMWDTEELHVMNDGEKMDEDKEESRNEELGDEDQEDEHQKARAIASPDLPRRREVEEHNLTHIPFRCWCNHCLRGRGRRSAHKRRDGVDDRAVTTYSIDYMYLTEGSATLGRPIIVGVDTETGGVHAHQVKSKGSSDRWIATRIAAESRSWDTEGQEWS